MCNCGKKKVSSSPRKGSAQIGQIVAYTGSRVTAIEYAAPGTGTYMLGDTSFAQQANVRFEDVAPLKEKYGVDLIVVPDELRGIYLPDLKRAIESVDSLSPFLTTLDEYDVTTIGQVLAMSYESMQSVFGNDLTAVNAELRNIVGLEG